MLTDFKNEGGFELRRNDGRVFGVQLMLIDSGDGNYMDLVYDYCRTMINTYPSKGFGVLSATARRESTDDETPSDALKYRLKKIDEDLLLYELSTNFYKKTIYRNLKIPRQVGAEQRAGFCDFPQDYGADYFKMLTAEELRSDGSFHAGGRRNEALDVRVYNLCAAHVI